MYEKDDGSSHQYSLNVTHFFANKYHKLSPLIMSVVDGSIFFKKLKTMTREIHVRRRYYFCYGWKAF